MVLRRPPSGFFCTAGIVGKRAVGRKPKKTRLRYNAGMQTTAIPPGPAEGFDLGGSEESLARLQRLFRARSAISTAFSRPAAEYTTTSSTIPMTSSACC